MRKKLPSYHFMHFRALKCFVCVTILCCSFNFSFTPAFSQAQLLKDINLDEETSHNEYSGLTAGNGIVYFINNYNELWRTTGTSEGTVRLRTFKMLSNLTVIGNTLYFAADNGSGLELWKSEGTSSTTYQIKDIFTGPDDSSPQSFVAVNNTIFFTATDGKTGRELWKTNGTAAGTTLVKDILRVTGNSNPSFLTNLNGTLYFSANDGMNGYELWRSDGSQEGTYMLKDINPGYKVSSSPESITAMNGMLVFSAVTNLGRELWKSNGTPAGTILVKDIFPGSNSSNIKHVTSVGNYVFFAANDGVYGDELWKSDGSQAGTVLVKDMTPGKAGSNGYDEFVGPMGNFTSIAGALYYSAFIGTTKYLWRSDGTAGGTVPLQQAVGIQINIPHPVFTLMNNAVYFFNVTMENGEYGSYYLWKMDTKGGNITPVTTFNMPNDYYAYYRQEMVSLFNMLIIPGAKEGGYKLWKSDGTNAGTVVLKDTYTPTLGSNMDHLVTANGFTFFQAQNTSGAALWRTNGTPAGTIQLKSINIHEIISVSTKVYFSGSTTSKWQLWSSDGTYAGTRMVREQMTATDGWPRMLTNVNEKLFYFDHNYLWKSDGTWNGTVKVKELKNIRYIYNVSGKIFINVETQDGGEELWTSNGTTAGTILVKKIRTGPGNPARYHHPNTSVNNIFYFTADDGVHGHEVWRSDGTPAGTFMLIDILPAEAYDIHGFESDIRMLGGFGNHVYISAVDYSGWSLYKSDGTTANTVRLGSMGSVSKMFAGKTVLYLFPNRLYHGSTSDIAITDGTPEGTKMLAYTTVNEDVSAALINDILYFNGKENRELWRSDGTSCGTYSFHIGQDMPYPLAALGTSLILGAHGGFPGHEPHVYPISNAPVIPCESIAMQSAESDSRIEASEDDLISGPNPFTSDFMIRLNGKSDDIAQIKVSTIRGEPVETLNDVRMNTEYRTGSTWPQGLYVIYINTGNRIITKKVIKK